MPPQKQLSEEDLRRLYQELLHVNQEIFEGGVYEASYHTLVAALYCAQGLNDVPGVEAIGQLAKEQLEWVDAHAPEYEHSTRSSAQRSHPNIYQNLMSQVRSRVVLMRSEFKSRGAR